MFNLDALNIVGMGKEDIEGKEGIEEGKKGNTESKKGAIHQIHRAKRREGEEENNKKEVGVKKVILGKWHGGEAPVTCRYVGRKRLVHRAVCEWHRLEKDEECLKAGCPRTRLGWGS